MKNMKRYALLFVFILVLGVLAACGGDTGTEDTENNDNNTNADSSDTNYSGSIAIAGSSTVFPIMEAVTYEYNQVQPKVNVSVESVGSGGGFKKFTRGETDLSNASRPIKDKEIALAEENDIKYTEVELAYDGLSVIVSKENDFLENITIEELQAVFLAEANSKNWSDVNSAWPNEPIKIYSPGHDSGTFDYFNEVILEEKPMREGQGVTLSEDDNLLVRGIEGDPYAIGYMGYAYYDANKEKVKVLGIDAGNGAVKPTPETIQDKSYSPLSRPLFTYVAHESMKKDQVVNFVQFMLNNAGQAAEQVGYVALPDAKYQEQLDNLMELAK